MPRINAFVAKRKIVKRRKFVARKRNTTAAKNRAGGELDPFRALRIAYSAPNPFPATVRRTMRWSENFSLASGNGLLGTQKAFYINSIYDPYAGIGGHQPYGHDVMAEIYNKYRVLAVRVTFLFTTPGGAHDMICVMSTSPNTSSGMTGLQNYQVVEQPGVTWGHLSTTGERRCVLQQNYDVAKVMGVSKAVLLAGDEYEATIGSNPSKVGYVAANVGCYDGTDNEACMLQVILEYDTIFFDRITLSMS